MATNESPSFDDFPEVETSDDSNGDWIDLGPGDEVTGTITGFNTDAGHNGVIEIDGRPMYLNSTMLRQLAAALVEGCKIAVRCDKEKETFTQDGEEVSYHPKEARFAHHLLKPSRVLQIIVPVRVDLDVLIVTVGGQQGRIDVAPVAGTFVQRTRERDSHAFAVEFLPVQLDLCLWG